ncbi:MAG: flagellar protein export ATPase FliI [Symbiobacteriia bacterium]
MVKTLTLPWEDLQAAATATDPFLRFGQVTGVTGLAITSRGPRGAIGDLCTITTVVGSRVPAEIIGFQNSQVILMPIGEMEGIGPGCRVESTRKSFSVGLGPEMLGRVLDGLGRPMDGRDAWPVTLAAPIQAKPPAPLDRPRIGEPVAVGVKALDGLLTSGKGQRLGIFAGSGVGKSTLMGMIARNTAADISVIALVGERGREVRDFLEQDLGPEGLKRSVVVVATSDQPALVRLKGAMVATAIAEFFRDQGLDVILMMDSVTRLAMAQREVGLAAGEPPATRGYPPSVFALLPRLLERSGTAAKGSITGFYTVLVDGDDMNEPVADAVRGILDGHVVLSRDLAAQNHYPAIDILSSVSRVMPQITSPEHRQAAAQVRAVLATMKEAQDLINIGAYQPGSNPRIDYAIAMVDAVNRFLRQDTEHHVGFTDTVQQVLQLFRPGGGTSVSESRRDEP